MSISAPDGSEAGAAAHHESILTISGMTCPACVRRVDRALRAVATVTDARIDLESGRATVQHGGDAATGAELCAAVSRAGYSASEAGASS